MIVDLDRHPKIGPYVLTRDLGPTTSFGRSSPVAPPPVATFGLPVRPGLWSGPAQPDRFLALHEHKQTSHVAYRFPPARTKAEETRLVAAVEACALVEHPHLLKIEQFTFDIAGQGWIVTPFPGDADGLRTLARLLREKGGQMSPTEVERAVVQLLGAVEAAHAGGLHHGTIALDEVLVDRRGAVMVELYGVATALRTLTPGGVARAGAEGVRDEVRSVVEIGYQLVTGLRAEEPIIPAGRLVRKLDPRWDAWFERGLDPSRGFDSAAAAAAALPSSPTRTEPARPATGVRGVLARFRS